MELIDKIANSVSRRGIITPEDLTELIKAYGDEVLKALQLLEPNRGFRVKSGKYEITVFSGESSDYIIFEHVNYCGCMSRHPININRRRYCPHLIAYKLLKALGRINVIETEENNFKSIMRYLKFNLEE